MAGATPKRLRAYVFPSQAAAQAAAAVVDKAQGYPTAGVDVGPGFHAPPTESQTVSYFVPLQHPTLAQWAYISDATADAALAGQTGLPVPATLDPGWDGAAQATAVVAAPLVTARRVAVAAVALAAAGIVAAAALSPSAPTPAAPFAPDASLDANDGGSE